MPKTYSHMLFIAPIYDQKHQIIDGLIYDDSKEAKQNLKREILYHQHQDALRKARLDQIAQFHMVKTTDQYYKTTNQTNPTLQKFTVYYEFGQFLKALRQKKPRRWFHARPKA